MTTNRAKVSIVGLVVALGACSNATGQDDPSEAAQAIEAMEQADADAVRACHDEAASCAAEHAGEQGETACQGMRASCQELEGQLAQVREQAVTCWEAVHECSGENCQGPQEQCRALRDTVRDARGPVVECGQNVRQCMHRAASSSADGAMELCGDLRQACSQGVAAASVARVRTAAQEQVESGEVEQGADGSSEGADASGQPEQDSTESGSPDAQAGDDTVAEEPMPPESESGEGDSLQTQEQQRACLEEVKACCDAAGASDADPIQLRKGGNSCALSACAEA